MEHGIKVNAPLLASYVNGNYNVEIYADGTKIRFGDVDDFKPAFPENIDVCITKKCDGGCPYCYEGCTINGDHGYIYDWEEHDLPKWMLSLKPGTELAINGNNLDHPHLERTLKELRNRGIITNMTVNQVHFIKYYKKLLDWQERELIYGIGVSITQSWSDTLFDLVPKFKNIILHVIAGIITADDLCNLQALKPKLLILGYKNLGRATQYSLGHADEIVDNIMTLKKNLPIFVKNDYLSGVCFDNLALDQLDVKEILFNNNEDAWSQFYMGDDGGFTMYIDTVAGKYAKNSCMPQDERYDIGDKTIDEMFRHIQDLYGKYE
jgi:hypothetical protein